MKGFEPLASGLQSPKPSPIAPHEMAAGEQAREPLSHRLSHSPAVSTPPTDTRALADALLAKAQTTTDPATVRALVDAARALLAVPPGRG